MTRSRTDRMQGRRDLHGKETNSPFLCVRVCTSEAALPHPCGTVPFPAGPARSGRAGRGAARREPLTHRTRAPVPPTGRGRCGRAGADWPRIGRGGRAGAVPAVAGRFGRCRAPPPRPLGARGAGVAGLALLLAKSCAVARPRI